MKKILIITQTTNTASGWGRYSSEIVRELKSKKLEVFVIEESERGGGLLRKYSFVSFIKNLFRARRAAENVDIVHVLDGWPYAVYGYFAILGTPKKLFINAVGTYSIPPTNALSIKRFLIKTAYKKALKVFSISSYTDTVLRGAISSVNSMVVHLGVDRLPESSDQSIGLVSNKINSSFPVILTVGALKRRKGQIYTLKAVSELKKDYSNILYVMVGDDSDLEYRSEIISYARENNLKNNILITGLIPDEELSTWYRNSDLFVLNSINHDRHFEGFGLVLIEAASAGLPAVGSRDCGIEDAIDDGYNGLLAEQGNVDDIVERIKTALCKKEVLGSNSIKFSRKFSWEKTIEIYIKHYNIDLLLN
jgi:glycosyltransferase involved in cell wall biosynthesis